MNKYQRITDRLFGRKSARTAKQRLRSVVVDDRRTSPTGFQAQTSSLKVSWSRPATQ